MNWVRGKVREYTIFSGPICVCCIDIYDKLTKRKLLICQSTPINYPKRRKKESISFLIKAKMTHLIILPLEIRHGLFNLPARWHRTKYTVIRRPCCSFLIKRFNIKSLSSWLIIKTPILDPRFLKGCVTKWWQRMGRTETGRVVGLSYCTCKWCQHGSSPHVLVFLYPFKSTLRSEIVY